MNEEKIYLSKKGYDEYIEEIAMLREKLLSSGKDKSQAYGNAIGDGWHDNFDFEEAKRNELKIIGEIQRRMQNLSRIVVVDTLESEDIIDIDDYISIKLGLSGKPTREMIVKIVGTTNPDLMAEISEISINSPLGKSLYQHKIGEKTNYIANGKKFDVEILDKAKSLSKVKERKK